MSGKDLFQELQRGPHNVSKQCFEAGKAGLTSRKGRVGGMEGEGERRDMGVRGREGMQKKREEGVGRNDRGCILFTCSVWQFC